MISGIIKVEASPRLITLAETLITGYHLNRIQLLFHYTLFYGNIQKQLCEMQIPGQTHQAAASLETIQVLKYLFRNFSAFCIFCVDILQKFRDICF